MDLAWSIVLVTVVLVSGVLAGVLWRRSAAAKQHELDQAYARLNVAEAELRAVQAHRHELNASLAAIGAAHRLLTNGSLLDQARRASITDMVDSELARLQRLSHGRLDPMAVSLADEVVVPLDRLIERLVVAHDVRGTRATWEPSGAAVLADADDVATALNVLLDNAVKHGADTVSVSVLPLRDMVEVEVSDNGPGLAPGLGAEIFEWGARGEGSSGTGIGLSVARDLAQRHGGYLALRSSDGRGTTFVLGLPRAVPGAATELGVDGERHEAARVS